jgi:hypothetical protein
MVPQRPRQTVKQPKPDSLCQGGQAMPNCVSLVPAQLDLLVIGIDRLDPAALRNAFPGSLVNTATRR